MQHPCLVGLVPGALLGVGLVLPGGLQPRPALVLCCFWGSAGLLHVSVPSAWCLGWLCLFEPLCTQEAFLPYLLLVCP